MEILVQEQHKTKDEDTAYSKDNDIIKSENIIPGYQKEKDEG